MYSDRVKMNSVLCVTIVSVCVRTHSSPSLDLCITVNYLNCIRSNNSLGHMCLILGGWVGGWGRGEHGLLLLLLCSGA